MGIGEWSALAAAAVWAASSLIYGRTRLSAWSINLCKNVIAATALLFHLAIVTAASSQQMFSAQAEGWFWLSISGLIGIVLGDTFFFRSLQILGPRRALIMATTAPVFAGLFGWLMLNEHLTIFDGAGILICMTGIIYVVTDQKAQQGSPGIYPGRVAMGVVLGLSGGVCQAFGGGLALSVVVEVVGQDNDEGLAVRGSGTRTTGQRFRFALANFG